MGFPALERRDLPEPPSLKNALGVGIVVMGLAIGTGELILWPHLVVKHDLSLLWLALLGIIAQYVINHEVARHALATGEGFFTSSARALAWSPLFWLIAAVLLYIWPGWASAVGTMLATLFGVGSHILWSWIALGLVLILTFSGRVVYRVLERSLKITVPTFFLILLGFSFFNLSWADVTAGLKGLVSFGSIPAGVDMNVLLGAVVFAGAGGMLNLVIGLWYRDKNFGMGAYVEDITNPVTGRTVSISPIGMTFEPNARNLSRWRAWMRYVRVDQGVVFLGLGFVTLFLLSINAYAVLRPQGLVPDGLNVAVAQANIFGAAWGQFGYKLFLAMSALMLFSVMWTVIDAFARMVSDIIHTNARVGSLTGVFRPFRRTSLHVLYYATITGVIIIGALLVNREQPLTLLVISGVLGGFTMALYTPLLIFLNNRRLDPALRPHLITNLAMVAITLFYWFFSYQIINEKFFSA